MATSVTAQVTVRVPDADVRLWRCATCGRWSHAKRRPQGHRRWDRQAIPYGWNGPKEHPPGDLVPCGPFEVWLARKVLEA